MKQGFDNEKYIKLQSQNIRDRIEKFGGKLYMEFGGKLFDDYHAARVLPGFQPDAKVKMLLELKDDAEIVIVINADAIEKNKRRGDLGITYDLDTLRLIDAFREIGLYVGSVVITCYTGQPSAQAFEKRLNALGIKTYRHYPIKDYPSNISHIISEDGFGKNDFVETERGLVVVTAPGPGSGKMATCLSQLYHEHKRGMKAGYSKFETFPVWNLPLRHPVNLAYEAATADLRDVNMIDPFHMDKYGIYAVNYNRDVEAFPLLSAIYQKISGECPYNSPTDMGVNMAGFCITDNDVVETAAKNEIIRRYYTALADKARRPDDASAADIVYKLELIMQQAGISPSERVVANFARERAVLTDGPAAAIEIDGHIVTGKTSSILGASSAAILNALKYLADIPDDVHLLSPSVLEPVMKLKVDQFGSKNPRLHTDEVLIVLAVCAVTDEVARRALDCVPKLAGCEVHLTVTPAHVDRSVFKKLGMNFTFDPIREKK